jgi:hypothetical protein
MTQPILPGYQIPNYWPHGYWQVNNQYWQHFPAPVVPTTPAKIWSPAEWLPWWHRLLDDDEVLIIHDD